VWLVAVIVLVVGASMLLYEWIERPLLRFFGRFVRELDRSLPASAPVPALVVPLSIDSLGRR
jgi:peptidoglycan/LPS O-acetylase OafA/YrhL